MPKKKHGGARLRAGRKSVDDKKQQLPVFVPGSWIDIIGWDESKALCYNALEKEVKKHEKK